MVSAERDGLKRILESYDDEEAVIASHRKPGDAVGLLGTPEKAKEKRIQVEFNLISSTCLYRREAGKSIKFCPCLCCLAAAKQRRDCYLEPSLQ